MSLVRILRRARIRIRRRIVLLVSAYRRDETVYQEMFEVQLTKEQMRMERQAGTPSILSVEFQSMSISGSTLYIQHSAYIM